MAYFKDRAIQFVTGKWTVGGLPKRLGEKLLNNNSSHEGGDKEISTGTSQMQIFFCQPYTF